MSQSTVAPGKTRLGHRGADASRRVPHALWLLRHPIFALGMVLSVGVFGACYTFFADTVPRILGFSHWFILPVLLVIATFATLHLESGRDPATRR